MSKSGWPGATIEQNFIESTLIQRTETCVSRHAPINDPVTDADRCGPVSFSEGRRIGMHAPDHRLPVCTALIHVLGIACRVLDERQ